MHNNTLWDTHKYTYHCFGMGIGTGDSAGGEVSLERGWGVSDMHYMCLIHGFICTSIRIWYLQMYIYIYRKVSTHTNIRISIKIYTYRCIYIYLLSRTMVSYPTRYRTLSYIILYYPISLNRVRKCPNETPKWRLPGMLARPLDIYFIFVKHANEP